MEQETPLLAPILRDEPRPGMCKTAHPGLVNELVRDHDRAALETIRQDRERLRDTAESARVASEKDARTRDSHSRGVWALRCVAATCRLLQSDSRHGAGHCSHANPRRVPNETDAVRRRAL